MWTPGDQYPHRAGRAFEDELDLSYVAPGAFSILPPDMQGLAPDPPMAINKHRLTPTTRKHRNAAFAIIAEPGSSNPNSRSPSPTGRVSPFRGRGFKPTGSRHVSPLPSPPPTIKSKRSKIPLARRDSTAQMLDGSPDNNLRKQLSKSLTSISPKRVPTKPPSGRYTKPPAFQKLSPIVGSSPEPTPHTESTKSPSKIPRSRSQPPSRTTSRNPSRSASRNVSRESSPSKLSLTKVNYKHVKAKVNSFYAKPKVPPKPSQVPLETSTDSDNNTKTEKEIEVVIEKNGAQNVSKRDSPTHASVASAIKVNKSANSKGDKVSKQDQNKPVQSQKSIDKTDAQVQGPPDVVKVPQVEGTPTLIDLLAPSTTTVVSSTTTTVTQPLKIDAKLEFEPKDDVYIPDGRSLSATSVSAAMNRMNDTVLDTKTLMKETKLASDVRVISSRSVMSPTNHTLPDVTDNRDVVALAETRHARAALPSVDSKDSNSINHLNVGNHNNNSINGRIGVVNALPKSANERIKEARTVVAADVQPLRITVREKPSDADVQSGNIRINHGVVNGIGEHPGLPPPQSPPELPPLPQEPPTGCCSRFLHCCRKKPSQTKQPDDSKSSKCSSCFCIKKKNDKVLSKASSDLSLIESQTNEIPKKWWQRLNCRRNKVSDSTTGCFSKGQRKDSWIPTINEESLESMGAGKRRFNIHRNTLWNKTKEARGLVDRPAQQKVGRQPIFTAEEEKRFIAHAIAMSSFGFPVTTFDLRCVVKAYLDRTGRKVPLFKGGSFPGREWAMSFMKRHKEILSERVSKNITYARAATDVEIVDTFFSHLEMELDSIPPERIWNYDETNVQDDPGSKKVITRRGAKYPEKIQNSSKACTSIMVCGNAAGELAPLYINYKSEKLWSTWAENGPDGARYNRTKSGWFDHQVLEDWFVSLMLPILKKQESASGSRCTAVPKDELPGLLKKMVIKLEENVGTNLKSGFRKTGIFPLDKMQVIRRLPKSVLEESLESMKDVIGDVFLDQLNKKREDVTGMPTKRRKMLNVPAGKSISVADVQEATTAKRAGPSSGTRGRGRGGGRGRDRGNKSPPEDIVEASSTSGSSSDDERDNKRW